MVLEVYIHPAKYFLLTYTGQQVNTYVTIDQWRYTCCVLRQSSKPTDKNLLATVTHTRKDGCKEHLLTWNYITNHNRYCTGAAGLLQALEAVLNAEM
jgi:hypothetical protein